MKRKYYEGQVIEGKIVKEVFSNMARSEYYLVFTDLTHKVIK
jgi:hypothetical protein